MKIMRWIMSTMKIITNKLSLVRMMPEHLMTSHQRRAKKDLGKSSFTASYYVQCINLKLGKVVFLNIPLGRIKSVVGEKVLEYDTCMLTKNLFDSLHTESHQVL